MTEAQVLRARSLIFAREQIEEFLSARDPKSAVVRRYLESKYDFQKREGKRLPLAAVVEIQITDANSAETAADEEPDTLSYWYLPRDVVERALKRELEEIAAELKTLGVDTNTWADINVAEK